jgi:hypothetical protein
LHRRPRPPHLRRDQRNGWCSPGAQKVVVQVLTKLVLRC